MNLLGTPLLPNKPRRAKTGGRAFLLPHLPDSPPWTHVGFSPYWKTWLLKTRLSRVML